MPYQRDWVENLQKIELKMEVAGTSKIEGADFTDRELDAVLKESSAQMITRSQRQAYAALQTYRWIATLEDDRPINSELVSDIHRRIITGADDDHCPPGVPRGPEANVIFGTPRHRGCEGGSDCVAALDGLTVAIRTQYREHDPLIQAMAAHYHLAAMHPFLDGNGRTARALEALMLQRAGLRDSCFVAMSNYYYDEKAAYLAALAAVRARDHDLTEFIRFSLRGIATQVKRLLSQIRREMQKALFRNTMFDLFKRMENPRKRVIADRQLVILQMLLAADGEVSVHEIVHRTKSDYAGLSNPRKAIIRDLQNLLTLRAVQLVKMPSDPTGVFFRVRLEWPTEITESEFFKSVKAMPTSKTFAFLGVKAD